MQGNKKSHYLLLKSGHSTGWDTETALSKQFLHLIVNKVVEKEKKKEAKYTYNNNFSSVLNPMRRD